MRMMAGFAVFNFLIMLIFLGISVYGFVLFVKLATRGIKALDIYIKNNEGHDRS